MSDRIPKNALVLVADGGKAMLLRNTSAEAVVRLQEVSRITPDTLGDQGPSGSQPPEQSAKQTAEATFAKRISQTLEQMHQQNQFEALVLIADPETLGQIRAALPRTVEERVVQSLAKDLTNHTTADIEKALSK